jgi:hypothetical protein
LVVPEAPESPPADSAKTHPGRFKPGQSGNPAGKPKGTRAAIYAQLDGLAAAAGPEILQALVDKAKEGDARAADILLRRAWPERKGRPLRFSMPELSGPAGLVEAMSAVTAGVANGDLTPDEATAIASVVEIHRKVIVAEDHEARLQALEGSNASKP